MMNKILGDRRFAILVPHPVLYETLCSEMVKKPHQVLLLTKYFKHVVKVPDAAYFEEACRLVELQASEKKGTASMVDITIMLVADDAKNNVKAILTRNGRDFAGFCQKKRIPMVDNMTTLNAV
ncbi:MAG: hypothetical protein K6A98_05350 [Prevotella sp.]|nr:hypothetical protein [Prevotella sp.]